MPDDPKRRLVIAAVAIQAEADALWEWRMDHLELKDSELRKSVSEAEHYIRKARAHIAEALGRLYLDEKEVNDERSKKTG